MHGEGTFRDYNGKTWEDKFFVKGVFQSKMQKKLKMEKMEKLKKKQILENAQGFFENFQNTFKLSKTNKKKDYRKNLAQYYASNYDQIKQHVRGPYTEYDYLYPSEWNEAFEFLKNFDDGNVLCHFTDAKLIEPQRIITA